jgi:aldehyde:ferredoxin oxidoreductase
METGNIISGTIDLLENGLIDKAMLNGLDLKWGNSQAILKMIEMIAKREGFGNVLADGAKGSINRFGKISENYFLNIKGMGTLATDDRFIPSFSLGIATSTRGADHLRSRPALDLYGLPEEVLEKIYGGYVSSDSSSHKGKSRMIWWHEILYSIVDSLGICKFQTIFIGVNAPKFEEYSRLIEFATGFSLSKDDLMNIGERTYTLERMFNNREGFTRNDDDLPKRYYDEKIPDGYTPKGKIISKEDFERLLDEYYKLHGWDNQGIPKKDTLQKLGLEKEPTHIL